MGDLSRRRKQLVLAICCMSLLMVGMDVTIVNLGLHAIRDELHTSLTDLQWTLDAYTVVLASLLMLGGSIADRFGRRRVFQTGLATFTVGSLLCALAPSLGWLIAFRVAQALGGSMMNPVAMSIITNVFTEPRERARAIGVWGGVVGLSFGVGPIVGGALIGSAGWRAIFWINIPFGLAALVLTALFVPESRAPRPRRLDPGGQLLVMALLGGLTFAIIEAPRVGWASVPTVTAVAVALLAGISLTRYEPRQVEPLIDLRFFRSVPFTGATLIAVCAFAASAGFLFLTSLYLQEVRGLSPLVAGLCLLPHAVMTAVCGPISGRLVGSRGARTPLLVAGGLLTAGALLIGLWSSTEPYVWLIASFVVFAAGFGLVNAPITYTAVSGMPREQAGVAAAIASTSRQVGAALGVAVIGSVVAAGVGDGLSGEFVSAGRAGWWVIAGCGLLVLVLGAATTGRRAQASAQRTADTVAREYALTDQLRLSLAGGAADLHRPGDQRQLKG